MNHLRRLADELGSITDRAAVHAYIALGWADRVSGQARRRWALYHHQGFHDLRLMAGDPADITEHYSTTAEGLQPCKQDCLFCQYGDTLTPRA